MNSIGDVSEPINNSTSIWSAWKSDVGCVFDRDPAARSVFEVLTTYPGVHAILIHRISHKLWLRKFRYAARLLSFFARLLSNVDIHPGAQIGKRFFIDHGACVVIGETAIVGDNVTLYHGVTLGGTSWNKGRRHPTLGNGVLVGTGAKILGPIEVASGARIGANSVVVQDVPSNSTVVGIPGRVVQNKPRDAASLGGVNLDHHLIPDPVGKAMGCLLERIDVLENKLQNIQKMGVVYPLELTRDCDPDTDICAEQCPIGVRITASKAAGGMRGPAKF